MKLVRVGELAWLVELAPEDETPALFAARLDDGRHPAVAGITPAACSVLVEFDGASCELPDGDAILTAAWRGGASAARGPTLLRPARRHHIPVFYDGADLAEVARRTGLSAGAVIARHAGVLYRVAFLGFQPGFAYLRGLDPALVLPRHATPRTRVPAGSVAIAEKWAGIYPARTPGGWQLLGRTEVQLFDATSTEPALLQAGDEVEFTPC